MCRSVAAALVWCALAAAPANAATIGVYDGPDLSAVALAGPDAVVLRQASGERSQLVVVPRRGGRPQTVLTVNRMNFVFEHESRRLAASAARVALIAEIEDARDRTVEWRVYSGPPRGPIGVARAVPIREAWVPALVDVDGDRALIVEARPEPDGPIRAFLLDSVAGLVPIPWARASARPIEISGGVAAASMAGPNRVAVLDLATGAELVTVPLPDRERGADLSLAPDGRVAVVTRAGVKVAGPGAAARLVPRTKGLKRLHLAGGTLSGIDTTGRAVALPVGGGRITTLGPPTRVFVDAAGDASGFAWIANGCARVAAIPASTAPRRSSDPCPTTEISYAYIASTRLRGRTITVPVGCVTAPRGMCRGTAIARIFEGDGRAAASGRFAIGVGKSREVKMRVTRAALAEFRREGYGNLVMDARIPNGRIGAGGDGSAELSVDLPGRDVARRTSAFGAAQSPETLTPDGPATLYSDWHGAITDEGEHPELLTGFRVVVQPGGRAGTIRFLVHQSLGVGEPGPRTVHVGPPVMLPAEPGTYTFPAPHVFADYRSVSYGVEQETGGHAITAQIRCSPEDGEGDICSSQSVDVYRPPLGGAIPDRRTATEVLRGRELTIDPITEPDVDRDGAGDETEDRTNLRASATTQRLSGHRRAFDITVENAGPRTADRPQVQAFFLPSPGLGSWTPACVGEQRQFFSGASDDDPRRQFCMLAPLAVGERRTVRLVVPDLGFGDAFLSASAEGRDLAGGDQDASPDVRGPRPPLSLEVAARPESIGSGIPVTVRSTRKGKVRLHVRRGNRTYARTITLRRAGKRDVVLRLPRRLARERGLVTLTARSGRATARARLQPSY
jgi:hypothetical protein